MGQLRSRDGCLTCRRRHVKCDEAKPVCGQCVRADRRCRQDSQSGELRIKRYKPRQATPQSSSQELNAAVSEQQHRQDRHSSTSILSSAASPVEDLQSRGSTTYVSVLDPGVSPIAAKSPSDIALATPSSGVTPSSLQSSHLLQHASPHDPGTYASPPSVSNEIALSRGEAFLLHHFAEYLARWLDCTDASRQFTLKMTTLVKTSPILLHSVVSFAARHMGDSDAADQAQQKCIELLIPLLSSETVADDEAILCAIVILRVCEQLSVTVTGSDQERHLAGFNALLKTSQGRQVDPSIPTLSQAAFWVYVRQCLYNACVNQQPPNVDFDLAMLPPPPADGLAIDVKTETAWANTITWICATVVHFCFSTSLMIADPLNRMRKWEELSKSVDAWQNTKPSTFDPIWYRDPIPGVSSPFPEIWFTADWHVMAFGFYHLACMLLAIYKPSPRFAVRSIRRVLPETDKAVMKHAHAICGACKSSPSTVPSLITLCHSTFIWAPLMMEDSERQCVIEMLHDLEERHAWPTAWIISALREEWAG